MRFPSPQLKTCCWVTMTLDPWLWSRNVTWLTSDLFRIGTRSVNLPKGELAHADTHTHALLSAHRQKVAEEVALGSHPGKLKARLQVTPVLLAPQASKCLGWSWLPLHLAGHWHWDTFSLASKSIWQSGSHGDHSVLAANCRDDGLSKIKATGLELNSTCTHSCTNKVTQASSA